VAAVIVAEPVNAETPVILENPTDFDGFVGAPPTLEARVQPPAQAGGTLSYQWYSGLIDAYSGASVQGATENRFTAADEPGVFYYWYTVTHVNDSASVTGEWSVETRSEIAKISLRYAKLTVTAGTITGGDYDGETEGLYAVGEAVTVTADAPPDGMRFDMWVLTPDLLAAPVPRDTGTLTFQMPAGDLTLAATYKTPPIKPTPAGGNGGSTERIPEEEAAPEDTGAREGAYQNPFTDVHEDDWFYDDVRYVCALGLFNGTSEDSFSPFAPMTRAMFVTVLYRLAGSPALGDARGTDFSDVENGLWYSDAVRWAARAGIVVGMGGGLFAPDADVTREQAAALLLRYARTEGQTLPALRDFASFADEDTIAPYAEEAVEALYRAEIVRGRLDDLFDPKSNATRAEAAAMLHRFIEATL
jgi:hypothetical protein